MVCRTSKGSDHPAHTRSLIRAFASRLNMTVKLLPEQHLEFISSKDAAQAGLCVHFLKCLIVGNHMSQPIFLTVHRAVPV